VAIIAALPPEVIFGFNHEAALRKPIMYQPTEFQHYRAMHGCVIVIGLRLFGSVHFSRGREQTFGRFSELRGPR